MAKQNKYSIQDLKKDFSTEKKCLEFIFETLHDKECTCGGGYKPLFEMVGTKFVGRRQYHCSKCRFQIAPTAHTIFHKSSTSLPLWFHALFVFSNAKSGISAKELERQIGVTYKTAWRMLTLIRGALEQSKEKLQGDVEVDGGFFGGKGNAGKDNKHLSRVMKKKGKVITAKQRGGQIRAQVTPDMKAHTIGKFLHENIETEDTRLMTDSALTYRKVAIGFNRHSVDHHIQEYVRNGDIHINGVESFYSHVKRSLKGTHKVISKEYLQSYVDSFVWHYNNRHNDRERFSVLLAQILHA